MRKIAIIVLCSVIAVIGALSVLLRDLKGNKFEVDGIYYEIVSDTSNIVAVTYKGSNCKVYEHEYSGVVVIPQELTYRGRHYTVTHIGDYAFSGCNQMTGVSIPASVCFVGIGAFSGCDGLKEIHINNLSSWCKMSYYDVLDAAGDLPFNDAVRLYLNGELITDLVVSEDVTEIGAHAFEGYQHLRSVVLHENIVAIHKSAFLNCTNLSSITIPKDICYIGPYAFDGTPWYENMPHGEIYIGRLLYKYKGEMPYNTSIVIKDGTETICQSAFDCCEGLTSITLPSSLRRIHNYAFNGCNNLIEIYCKTQSPPYYNRFYNDYHSDAKLYIPTGTIETYKNDGFMGAGNGIETDF